MITIEIPRDQWEEFLYSFSERHEGWLAHLETPLDTESGTQRLKSIAMESESLMLIETETQETVATHIVRNPSRLAVDITAEGAEAGLVVESPEGTLMIRFRSAIRPELVDGAA